MIEDSGAERVEILTMPPGDFDVLMVQMNVPAIHFQRLRQERPEAEDARQTALRKAEDARRAAARVEAARLYALPEAVAARARAREREAAREREEQRERAREREERWANHLRYYCGHCGGPIDECYCGMCS